MTDVATHYRQPEFPESVGSRGLERNHRPKHGDGAVAVAGIRIGVGILVTVNNYPLGFAEPDGSEEPEEVSPEPSEPGGDVGKPSENVSLKNIITSQTSGDTQKIALYLAEVAEQGGKKVKVTQLSNMFGISNLIVQRIIATLRGRAEANRWPFVISYSQSAGVSFATRKEAFRPR